MTDDRKNQRMNVSAYIRVRENNNNRLLGKVTNMSAEGMRLCGHEPLRTGSRVECTLHLPCDIDGRSRILFDADVIWSRPQDAEDRYDAGIKLNRVPAEDVDAIERFIHMSPQHERWLSVVETASKKR
ncbi:MAG: PilZ domain-containing protein [candidate division Zixibacteria bacterium]|nr:PilZ domain-containing protein [candidate division Zixibacteria bacterium]